MHELTVTRTQFSVFHASVVLYMPFGIASIHNSTNVPIPWLSTFGYYMGCANSCMNSLIYGFMNRNIRKAYIESLIFLKKKDDKQVHSVTLLSLKGQITNTSLIWNHLYNFWTSFDRRKSEWYRFSWLKIRQINSLDI